MAITHAFSNAQADATGTVTVWNGASTSSVVATNMVRPSDWNSAHVMAFSVTGNTTSGSTASGTDIYFAGSGPISLGATSNSIFVSAPAQTTLSYFENLPLNAVLSVTFGGSTNRVGPYALPLPVSADFLRIPVTGALTTTTFATGANAYGNTLGQSNTVWVNFYSLGTGASSQSLQYVTGASTTYAFEIQYSGTASTHSVTYNFTMPTLGGGSTSTQLTTSAQSSAVNEVPGGTTAFTAGKMFDMPFAASLSAGNYWVAVQRSSTTNVSNINFAAFPVMASQTNIGVGIFGSAAIGSIQLQQGNGIWTTNSNGTTTASMAMSQISSAASHLRPIVHLHRSA